MQRPPKGNDAANTALLAVEKSTRSEVLALPSGEWPKIESKAVERKITSSYGVDSRPLLGRLKDASWGGGSTALPSESTRGGRGEPHLRRVLSRAGGRFGPDVWARVAVLEARAPFVMLGRSAQSSVALARRRLNASRLLEGRQEQPRNRAAVAAPKGTSVRRTPGRASRLSAGQRSAPDHPERS